MERGPNFSWTIREATSTYLAFKVNLHSLKRVQLDSLFKMITESMKYGQYYYKDGLSGENWLEAIQRELAYRRYRNNVEEVTQAELRYVGTNGRIKHNNKPRCESVW